MVYPALLLAIPTSIPTVIEGYRSLKYGVPWGDARFAKDQNDLWRKNLECTGEEPDWLTTKHNVKVDATICVSGDVFVKFRSPDGTKSYRWVPVSGFLTETASFTLVGAAWAGEESEEIILAQARVICQRWLSEGRLLRRVQTPEGCFDEIVNTYTGAVESRSPAPCDSEC